jgi:hypothetical protein
VGALSVGDVAGCGARLRRARDSRRRLLDGGETLLRIDRPPWPTVGKRQIYNLSGSRNAGLGEVAEEVVWKKLEALCDGADIATRRLF